MSGMAKEIAEDLGFVIRSMGALRDDLVRFDPRGDKELSGESAKHIILRLGTLESLTNNAKKKASDAKRAAETKGAMA
jgi:hypothetical protein